VSAKKRENVKNPKKGESHPQLSLQGHGKRKGGGTDCAKNITKLTKRKQKKEKQ